VTIVRRNAPELSGLNTLDAHEHSSSETFARYGLSPSGNVDCFARRHKVPGRGYCPLCTDSGNPRAHSRKPLYQGLSRTLPARIYMALDTLATLSRRVYDLIVVDPRHAASARLLEAPQRLQRFSTVRRANCYPFGNRQGLDGASAVNRTVTFLLRKIEEATHLSIGGYCRVFYLYAEYVHDFGDRFGRVNTLLASAETAFLLVTSPEEEVLAEAEEFRVGLERLGMALKGVVMNRMHEQWQASHRTGPAAKALTERLRPALRLTVRDSYHLPWWRKISLPIRFRLVVKNDE